ncbi:hypothetical protein XELAEV_18031005mg [Xenopus laevis]|uniref:Uncharacterized protein n=1 Tax=Xenopus laevis TaxID=8355 RepID=A0A974CLW3_XENLA|nr:hypothetical protein XELAEV_18031005mg [Xenopus laevis]
MWPLVIRVPCRGVPALWGFLTTLQGFPMDSAGRLSGGRSCQRGLVPVSRAVRASPFPPPTPAAAAAPSSALSCSLLLCSLRFLLLPPPSPPSSSTGCRPPSLPSSLARLSPAALVGPL